MTSPPDGFTVGVGGPPVDTPWIVSPVVRGSAGLQGLLTVCDVPEFLLRLGAGWAELQSTRTAPPFQDVPGREWSLDGSELAVRHDGGEFYASVQRRNWGPGWTGSLILDGAAPPLAAVGWRRPLPQVSSSPWLQWMGPWMADVFFGRLFGHDPRLPALIGLRLQLQPFDRLQLGLSRTLQWGGQGRDESFESLMHGLIGWDNVGTRGITADNEPGNQLGGFDWRLELGDERRLVFYGQMVGEDENGYLPSAYIAQAGFEARWVVHDATVRGFVEYNDLIAGHVHDNSRPPGITYTSSVYRHGYTHDHMPLGHPAGGDVTLASVGLLVQTTSVRVAVVASHGDALPTSQRFAAGPISGLNGSLQLDIDARQQLGAGVWWWRDTAQRQRALQVWWRLLL
ncbi:MAG TPA: capsule assembly Wzi family protein [Burkholderiaceae bacterium]|nr:capsule assembly Wzi family protein [Burkholderiaceae bacterium]